MELPVILRQLVLQHVVLIPLSLSGTQASEPMYGGVRCRQVLHSLTLFGLLGVVPLEAVPYQLLRTIGVTLLHQMLKVGGTPEMRLHFKYYAKLSSQTHDLQISMEQGI